MKIKVVPIGDKFAVMVKRWGRKPVFADKSNAQYSWECDEWERVLAYCLFDTQQEAQKKHDLLVELKNAWGKS
jgi:hypothetical protein